MTASVQRTAMTANSGHGHGKDNPLQMYVVSRLERYEEENSSLKEELVRAKKEITQLKERLAAQELKYKQLEVKHSQRFQIERKKPAAHTARTCSPHSKEPYFDSNIVNTNISNEKDKITHLILLYHFSKRKHSTPSNLFPTYGE